MGSGRPTPIRQEERGFALESNITENLWFSLCEWLNFARPVLGLELNWNSNFIGCPYTCAAALGG